MKKKNIILVSIVILVLIAGIVFGLWRKEKIEEEKTREERMVVVEKEQQEAFKENEGEDIYLGKCNLNFSKNKLRIPENYDIFGDENFDAVVCGYLVNEDIERMLREVTMSYLRIIEAGDDEFEESLRKEINNGNNVNRLYENNVYFSLGCFEEDLIKSDHNFEDYMDEETQSALLNSTKESPVALVLSFEPRKGTGCFCCNPAYKIRLAKDL